MRYVKTLLTAGLAELAAHWLSIGWGFMVITAAFVFVAVHVTAGMADVRAKAVTTEARVNGLIPTVNAAYGTANNALPKSGGTVTGSLTVNGDHLIGGTLYGAGFGSVTTTNLHASSGGITADNDITAHGNMISDNNVTASASLSCTNGVNVNGNLAISSSRRSAARRSTSAVPWLTTTARSGR
jgi:hypothetical protein